MSSRRLFFGLLLCGCGRREEAVPSTPEQVEVLVFDDLGRPVAAGLRPKEVRSPGEWRQQLTLQQFYATREGSTDTPFTGTYYQSTAAGLYRCVCCGNALFGSAEKFDSGTGWPSFTAPVDSRNIWTREDLRGGEKRVEVLCRVCDAHLGHVFEDGPAPAHLRYCINESALRFVRSPG